MSVFVFLGPSLKRSEAASVLPTATFLPPACMGDVLTAVDRGAKIIGIVDGLFEQVLSVWHKEVLHALHSGVRVLGAASMGALRAAELHPFGMEGVGEIFDAFAAGTYEDDDEVAVAHATAEDGHRPLSEAMVNLRAGLRRARERGLLDAREHDALVAALKAVFYPERSWALARELALAAEIPAARVDALIADVRRDPPDVKRRDALRLLERIGELVAAGTPPHVPSFDFEPTIFWDRLMRRFRDGLRRPDGAVVNHGEPVADDEIERLARLRHGRALERDSLVAFLAEREAEHTGITVDSPRWRAAAERFRRERGLGSAEDLKLWLDRQGVSEDDFVRLVHRDALLTLVSERHRHEIGARTLDVLKARGEVGSLRDDVRRRRQRVRSGAVTSPLTVDELVAWFVKKTGPFETTQRLWERFGFADAETFHAELALLHTLELSERAH